MGKKFAILRFQKIKSFSKLKAHSNHLSRKRETLNADQDSLHAPQAILGSGDHEADARQAIESLSRKPRKNATLAIEAILTASPDWIRDGAEPGGFNAQRVVELTKSAKAFLEKQFPGCPISATLHLDESTPHIHATIIPIDETPTRTGKRQRSGKRLNASRWLDGPEKLQALQDAWAAETAHIGLERGLKGSKARHEPIKRLYAKLESDADAMASSKEKAQALTAGIDAYTSGKIVDARMTEKGKSLIPSQDLTKEQRAHLAKQIQPSFNEVWEWIAKQSNELKTAKAKAIKSVQAVLNKARELSPYLDNAGKNKAAKLAYSLEQSKGGDPAKRGGPQR